MTIFLQILGGLFLLLILVVGFYGLRFYRRIRSGINENGDFIKLVGILPPLRLMLEQSAGDDWIRTDMRNTHQQVLENNGFEHAGYFHSEVGMVEAKVSLWGNPQQGITVALMEASGDGEDEVVCTYAVDLFIYFTDGSSLTITNNKDASLLPRPTEQAFAYYDSQDIKQLFSQIKLNMPANKRVKPVRDIKQLFREQFERSSDWVWQEPQLRSTQLQEAIAPLGIQFNDELVDQLLDYALSEKSELISERILHRVAQSHSMSAETWENIRERLVVVHDSMQPHDLVTCLYGLLEHLNDEEEEAVDAITELDTIESPLGLFLETLEGLKGARRIKRVTAITEPVAAHVYLVG